MSPETELRRAPERGLPDLDAEQEVDLGRYWNAIAAHWWLPLAGLAVGIVLGYLVSLGGSDVYQAKAMIYMGQPLSPTGGAQVQTSATNPTTVREILNAESTIQAAAQKAGLRPGDLRGHISTSTVAGALQKQGQTPLATITVTGKAPRKVALATNALADAVVADTSPYVRVKIRTLKARLASEKEELASIDSTIAGLRAAVTGGGSATDRLILTSELNSLTLQRGQTVSDKTDTQAQLSFAENVESASVLTRAAARKTTARSHRNSALVGAVIGLLLGVIAALLWEPALRFARRPRV